MYRGASKKYVDYERGTGLVAVISPSQEIVKLNFVFYKSVGQF